MWELQRLSNNRRTTKNLSIIRRKHLTYSLTNTSQFCGITLSSLSSSLLYLGVPIGLNALPIYRQ